MTGSTSDVNRVVLHTCSLVLLECEYANVCIIKHHQCDSADRGIKHIVENVNVAI